MKKNYIIFFFLICFFKPELKAQYKPVFIRDSITVYSKPEQNGLSFYKAVSVINCPLDSLYKFFTDFEHFTEWINYCSEVIIIEQIKDSLYLYYSYYDFPFPADDRETLSELRILKFTDDTIIVENKPAKLDFPQSAPIRITNFKEKYILTKIDSLKVQLIMQGAYDPGGLIPDWLTERMLKYGPYDIIIKIKSMLEEKTK